MATPLDIGGCGGILCVQPFGKWNLKSLKQSASQQSNRLVDSAQPPPRAGFTRLALTRERETDQGPGWVLAMHFFFFLAHSRGSEAAVGAASRKMKMRIDSFWRHMNWNTNTLTHTHTRTHATTSISYIWHTKNNPESKLLCLSIVMLTIAC